MRISWDSPENRVFETGTDRGVFYRESGGKFTAGVPWNGLSEVTPNRSGTNITNLYSGGYRSDIESMPEEFGGKIKCFTYPEEVEPYIGAATIIPGFYAYQQKRSRFGFSYRTYVGNGIDGLEHGYKLHLIYNAQFTDLSTGHKSIGSQAEPEDFEFTYEAIPISHPLTEPYSEIVIDSRQVDSGVVEKIEDIIYGSEYEYPRLPDFEELYQIYYLWKYSEITKKWVGYPYETLYPSTALHPYPLEPGELYPVD